MRCEDMNITDNEKIKDLIARVKANKPELETDFEVIEYALLNTISSLEKGHSNVDMDVMMARMEQLETRLLEQDLMNKKILRNMNI
jgi:hypothetical protein